MSGPRVCPFLPLANTFSSNLQRVEGGVCSNWNFNDSGNQLNICVGVAASDVDLGTSWNQTEFVGRQWTDGEVAGNGWGLYNGNDGGGYGG